MDTNSPNRQQEVDEWYRKLLAPEVGSATSGSEPDLPPNRSRVVFSGRRFDSVREFRSRIWWVDLDGQGTVPHELHDGGGSERLPKWSPDGTLLAYLSDRDGTELFQLWLEPSSGTSEPRKLGLAGYSVEHHQWIDNGRLLVLAAEEGAEQPAVSGSGSVRHGDGPATAPEVRGSGDRQRGWRRLFILNAAGGLATTVSARGSNIWEADFVDGESVLSVVSSAPSEGSWAHSRLELTSLAAAAPERIYNPQWQLACPTASGGGDRVAVIEGVASDRGAVAGQVLLLEGSWQRPIRLETGDADATWIQFRDPDHLAFIGLKDSETLVGEIDLSSGRTLLHYRGHLTTPGYFPTARLHPEGGLILFLEEWQQPPRLVHVREGQLSTLVNLGGAGFQKLQKVQPPIQRLTWDSTDGTPISGFWIPPAGKGPHPTALLVHGGPAGCWQPWWPSTATTRLAAYLVQLGIALFMPNPRGSTGRGLDFAAMELGDYGGLEVDDHLTGLDLLVAEGLADPDRLAVIGGSHGGYMASWLTTRTSRFRAAVAMSPVTNWYSQHYESNIPEFDRMYLRASPTEPGGAYFERSPVFAAHRSRTPTLLTAGGRDRCTPPGQAVEFHQALLEHGVDTELILYPEEGHGVRTMPSEIDLVSRIHAFLDRHLLGSEPVRLPPAPD